MVIGAGNVLATTYTTHVYKYVSSGPAGTYLENGVYINPNNDTVHWEVYAYACEHVGDSWCLAWVTYIEDAAAWATSSGSPDSSEYDGVEYNFTGTIRARIQWHCDNAVYSVIEGDAEAYYAD